MRKVLILAAMVALMAATVVSPAMAQHIEIDDDNDLDEIFFFNGFDRFDDLDRFGFGDVGQDFEQEAESGDVDLSFQTSNTGDNSNVCAPALQFGNTGNLQNQQGFTSVGNGFNGFFGSGDGFFRNGFDFFDFNDNGVDDVEFEGSEMVFEPSLATSCDQSVEQAAAASSK